MRDITKSTITSKILTDRTLILVTEGIVGHKVDWLYRLNSLAKANGKGLLVLTLHSSSQYDLEDSRCQDVLHCGSFKSKKEIISFINSLNFKGLDISFWDCDKWLISIVGLNKEARLLVMRPYIVEFRIMPFIRFTFKKLILIYLTLLGRFKIRYLEVPFSGKLVLRNSWVSDEQFLPSLPNLPKREILDFGTSRKVVLLPGFIDSRKNPLLLVSAVRAARENSNLEIQLIISGKLDSSIRAEMLLIHDDWIQIRDGYKSETDYWAELMSCDLVVLPYSNRGSSGIAIQAIWAGKQVLLPRMRIWENASKMSNRKLHFFSHLNTSSLCSGIIDALEIEIEESGLVLIDSKKLSALEFVLGI